MFCFSLMHLQCTLLQPFGVVSSIKDQVKQACFERYDVMIHDTCSKFVLVTCHLKLGITTGQFVGNSKGNGFVKIFRVFRNFPRVLKKFLCFQKIISEIFAKLNLDGHLGRQLWKGIRNIRFSIFQLFKRSKQLSCKLEF